MIKKLLSFAAVAAMAFGFTAKAETLDILPSLNNAAYDAATKTITFEKEWSWVNWWVGEADYSQWDAIVIEFEPVDFTVQIAINYNDESLNASFQAQAGETKLVAPLNEGKVSVQQYAIQNSAPGTLVLKAAYLQNEENVDPSAAKVLFDGSQALDWWDNAIKLPVSDFIAAKIKAGDDLNISYVNTGDPAADKYCNIKVQLLLADWSQAVLPGFKACEGFQEEYGTVNLSEPSGVFTIKLTDEDVEQLTDGAANQSLMLVGENITVTKVELVPSTGTVGVDNVAVEENAPVEYYNLQGVKVSNPASGIYVVRQGNKVSKVLVK